MSTSKKGNRVITKEEIAIIFKNDRKFDKKKGVLIVENAIFVQKTLGDHLEKHDIYFEKFSSLGELENVDIGKFGCISMCLSPEPEKSIEWIKKTRRKYPNLRIVVCSGYLSHEKVKLVLKAGADNYIIKQVTEEEYIEGICGKPDDGHSVEIQKTKAKEPIVKIEKTKAIEPIKPIEEVEAIEEVEEIEKTEAIEGMARIQNIGTAPTQESKKDLAFEKSLLLKLGLLKNDKKFRETLMQSLSAKEIEGLLDFVNNAEEPATSLRQMIDNISDMRRDSFTVAELMASQKVDNVFLQDFMELIYNEYLSLDITNQNIHITEKFREFIES